MLYSRPFAGARRSIVSFRAASAVRIRSTSVAWRCWSATISFFSLMVAKRRTLFETAALVASPPPAFCPGQALFTWPNFPHVSQGNRGQVGLRWLGLRQLPQSRCFVAVGAVGCDVAAVMAVAGFDVAATASDGKKANWSKMSLCRMRQPSSGYCVID